MLAAIIIGAIVVALVVGFWLTRNAKGPTQSEVILKTTEAEARIGPRGEPTDWTASERPPDY